MHRLKAFRILKMKFIMMTKTVPREVKQPSAVSILALGCGINPIFHFLLSPLYNELRSALGG